MSDAGPIGTVLQFGHRESDLPQLLRRVAASIEGLGEAVEILDVVVRAAPRAADVYFRRLD
jgi:hypothetical protein